LGFNVTNPRVLRGREGGGERGQTLQKDFGDPVKRPTERITNGKKGKRSRKGGNALRADDQKKYKNKEEKRTDNHG